MKILKVISIIVGIIMALTVLLFGFGMIDVAYKSFFKPKYENVDRATFEKTKPYVHGNIQDIAKLYEEYHKAESEEDKEAIKNLIKIRFAEFDANLIKSQKLRNFFETARGY